MHGLHGRGGVCVVWVGEACLSGVCVCAAGETATAADRTLECILVCIAVGIPYLEPVNNCQGPFNSNGNGSESENFL